MFRNFTSGFDSFDPDNFDPTVARKVNNADNGSGGAGYTTTAAKPGQKMQVNLTLTNATLVEQTVELFSFLDSWVRRRKTEYIPTGDPTAYLMYPMLSYEGLLRIVAGTGGVVGFNSSGDLIVRGDDSGMVDDPIVTVGCSEIAYASFFEASGITPFEVAYLRQTVTTDAQINKNITWFKKSFSGGIKENTISPRAYFRPNQYQPKTIDITVSFTIGIDSGLRMNLLAGETVQFAMFIQFWTGQYIS